MTLNEEAGVQRTVADMVDMLRRHRKLLVEYGDKAFNHREEDYLGEVATKLRLLVVPKRSNVPLLVRLMSECQLDDRFVLGDMGPPAALRPAGRLPGDIVTLKEFLDLPAFRADTSVGPVTLTKRQLIEVLAEKHGAAHEDWNHPESLVLLLKCPVRVITGYSPQDGIVVHSALVVELGLTTRAVLELADRVLSQLTPEVIEQAERRRRTVP